MKKFSRRLLLNRTSGFTLIELVMAIVVVAIVAVPLSLTVSQYIVSAFALEDSVLAVNLARLEMERVNALSFTGISSASTANYESSGYDMVRTVTYAAGSALSAESLKQISVEIRKSGQPDSLVTLITYRANSLSYGI